LNEEARLEAVVRGMVQGVGFRYFVERQARSLGIVGYVRNRPDGGVEVVAEGDRSLLEDLLSSLRRGPSGAHVSGVYAYWGENRDEFKRFEIGF
jgi:acylphosphatase